jgi:hypothetical protein
VSCSGIEKKMNENSLAPAVWNRTTVVPLLPFVRACVLTYVRAKKQQQKRNGIPSARASAPKEKHAAVCAIRSAPPSRRSQQEPHVPRPSPNLRTHVHTHPHKHRSKKKKKRNTCKKNTCEGGFCFFGWWKPAGARLRCSSGYRSTHFSPPAPSRYVEEAHQMCMIFGAVRRCQRQLGNGRLWAK